MFRSRNLSFFALAGLLLVAFAALTTPVATASDGETGVGGDIYTVTIFYASGGQWVTYNQYFATVYDDGRYDDGGAVAAYDALQAEGHSVTYTSVFWRRTNNGDPN